MLQNVTTSDETTPGFVAQNVTAKSSPVGQAIKSLNWYARTNKFNYDDLRYIFRRVRKDCAIAVPRKGKKLIELPIASELEQFYGVITSPIHRLIFETLEGTGMRVSELVRLEVKRIDFENNQFFISEGKGGKDRIGVIGNRLKEKLKIYLEGKNNRFLFESRWRFKYSTRRIEQLCEKYKRLAGISKDLTPHTLRHLWNTRLAEADVTKEKRALLAGHSSDKTQDIYTHLAIGGFKDQIIGLLDK